MVIVTTYWMTRMQGWVITLKMQIPSHCFTSQILLQAYHHSLLFRGNQSSILFLEKITSLMGIWEKAKIAASSASSAVKIAHFFTAELQWIGFQNKKKKGRVDDSVLVKKKNNRVEDSVLVFKKTKKGRDESVLFFFFKRQILGRRIFQASSLESYGRVLKYCRTSVLYFSRPDPSSYVAMNRQFCENC